MEYKCSAVTLKGTQKMTGTVYVYDRSFGDVYFYREIQFKITFKNSTELNDLFQVGCLII